MRAFVVEDLAEAVEAALLSAQAAGGGAGGLGLEGPVHAFVTAVLLGLAGLNEFGENTQSDPPGGE